MLVYWVHFALLISRTVKFISFRMESNKCPNSVSFSTLVMDLVRNEQQFQSKLIAELSALKKNRIGRLGPILDKYLLHLGIAELFGFNFSKAALFIQSATEEYNRSCNELQEMVSNILNRLLNSDVNFGEQESIKQILAKHEVKKIADHKRSVQKDPIDINSGPVDMTELVIVEDERRDVVFHHQDFQRLCALSKGSRISCEYRMFYTHKHGAAIEEHKLKIKEASSITDKLTVVLNGLSMKNGNSVEHRLSCIAANLNISSSGQDEHSNEYTNSSYQCRCEVTTGLHSDTVQYSESGISDSGISSVEVGFNTNLEIDTINPTNAQEDCVIQEVDENVELTTSEVEDAQGEHATLLSTTLTNVETSLPHFVPLAVSTPHHSQNKLTSQLRATRKQTIEDLSIKEPNQKKAHESIEKRDVLEKTFEVFHNENYIPEKDEGNIIAINNNDFGSNNDDQVDHNNQNNQASLESQGNSNNHSGTRNVSTVHGNSNIEVLANEETVDVHITNEQEVAIAVSLPEEQNQEVPSHNTLTNSYNNSISSDDVSSVYSVDIRSAPEAPVMPLQNIGALDTWANILQAEMERASPVEFNIQDYEAQIINSISESTSTDIVEIVKDAKDIPKTFVASMHLLSTNNIELTQKQGGLNDVHLTLLTKKGYEQIPNKTTGVQELYKNKRFSRNNVARISQGESSTHQVEFPPSSNCSLFNDSGINCAQPSSTSSTSSFCENRSIISGNIVQNQQSSQSVNSRLQKRISVPHQQRYRGEDHNSPNKRRRTE